MLRRRDLQQQQGSTAAKSLLIQQKDEMELDKRIRRFEVLSREAQSTKTKHLKQKYGLVDMDIKNTLGMRRQSEC